ncbi:DUF2798 domain-containing protein [Bacillus proteolyticus]|uniref:DUF2798 domain-containing protein n=1 Tax=Bacillus proteolyticus TaxID=2026192 RepID=UPI000B07B2A5|nr:DUF2798 domain-containing protein [Bacillus proteolyticus]
MITPLTKAVIVVKINKKYEPIILTILTGLCTSGFISFVLVSINIGYNPTFLIHWPQMWGEAFISSIPCAYYFPRIIRKFMNLFTFVEKEKSFERVIKD